MSVSNPMPDPTLSLASAARVPKWYIAAPFFNEEQLRLVQGIEEALQDADVPFYSPRLIHGSKPVPIKTDEDARKVYRANVDNIHDCTAMLAVIDWLNKPGQEIRLVDHEQQHRSGPLNLPDAGTVFEFGYAAGLSAGQTNRQWPVVIYTERTRSAKLNIMLSQPAAGVVSGMVELKALFPGNGIVAWSSLKPWIGGHT